MVTINSATAVADLLKRVPAFAAVRAQDESYISYDDASSYLVFGDFARFLEQLVVNRSSSETADGILAESFSLLSELATSPDAELADLAIVGVFEYLADCPDCVTLARRMLSPAARKIFERVLRGWV